SAIAIIGGADGPTAIFLASRLAPDLLGAIAVAAYSYMALVPISGAAEGRNRMQSSNTVNGKRIFSSLLT
ncbi:hypothetical protein QQ73_20320, partial [Candidatus Endoriftia persephone str. Guaymas]|nr:hypothetical protein [Candidatus Endoriftia persephone str. Guaymas]